MYGERRGKHHPVLTLGLLRLPQRGLSVYRGSLTNWPPLSSLLWEVYHRPIDAMAARVAQAWRFHAPVALHHRLAMELGMRGSRREGQYETLDAQLKHQRFGAWPPSPEERADSVHGPDGRTLRQVLGSWGVQGLHELTR